MYLSIKLTDTILTDQDDVFLPDAEVVAEAADGGEEGDDDDDRGDDGGDVRVRGPLVRRVQAGVRALACNQGFGCLGYISIDNYIVTYIF